MIDRAGRQSARSVGRAPERSLAPAESGAPRGGGAVSPVISVVVPVFNAVNYLPACIESILAQTLADIEVVIVDDGSSDGSSAVCDEYAAKDARIVVIHQPNTGLPAARKCGVRSARGAYIAFVDSDDWIDTTHCANLYKPVRDYNVDVVFTGFIRHSRDGSTRLESNFLREGLYGDGQIVTELLSDILPSARRFAFGMFPSAWTKLMRRELLLRAMADVDDGLTVGEDLVLVLRALALAKSAFHLGQPFGYHYRFVANSMIHKVDTRRTQAVAFLLDEVDRVLALGQLAPAKVRPEHLAAYLATAAAIAEVRRLRLKSLPATSARLSMLARNPQVLRAARALGLSSIPPKRRPVWLLIRALGCGRFAGIPDVRERPVKTLILFVPTLRNAGAETLTCELALGMRQLGWSVTIATTSERAEGPLMQRAIRSGVEVIDVSSRTKLGTAAKAAWLLLRRRPDAVHTHLSSVLLVMAAATLARVPIRVHTFHSLAQRYGRRHLYRAAIRQFGFVPVAIAEPVRESVHQYLGVSLRDIRLVPNGVDLSRFTPSPVRAAGPTVVMAVGRLDAVKNHRLLVRAFAQARVPDAELWIVGEGPERTLLEALVSSLGLHAVVRLLGAVDDVAPLLRRASVFALSSDAEGMPMSLLEAMATGLPVVSTKAGGVIDLVEEGRNGHLVNVGDESGLARAIRQLVTNKADQARMGRESHSIASQRGMEVTADAYARIYMESSRLS